MVAVVDEVGYEGMRVGRVADRAGVSRSTLYEYFEDRDDCFLATFDALMEEGTRRLAPLLETDLPWEERLHALLTAIVGQIVEQPAAARLCLLELYCVGPQATPRRDRAAATLERIARQAIQASPDHADMPPALVSAIVGGIRTIFQKHLRRGAEHELPGQVDGILQWALSYPSPPQPLRPEPHVSPQGPRWTPSTQIERLCAAVCKTVCEKGYHETKVVDIASAASMSLSTFYSHFSSKREAFFVACDAGTAHGFNAAYEAYKVADGAWPRQLHTAMRKDLQFLSAEPEWTYMASIEQFGAGAKAQERRDRSMDMFTAQLSPGFELAPELSPITRDAIGGAMYTLTYSHICNRGAEHVQEILPLATYLALTPFVGADEAVAIINDGDPLAAAGSEVSSQPA
jgi:AcrR family transcriptional regulator